MKRKCVQMKTEETPVRVKRLREYPNEKKFCVHIPGKKWSRCMLEVHAVDGKVDFQFRNQNQDGSMLTVEEFCFLFGSAVDELKD